MPIFLAGVATKVNVFDESRVGLETIDASHVSVSDDVDIEGAVRLLPALPVGGDVGLPTFVVVVGQVDLEEINFTGFGVSRKAKGDIANKERERERERPI